MSVCQRLCKFASHNVLKPKIKKKKWEGLSQISNQWIVGDESSLIQYMVFLLGKFNFIVKLRELVDYRQKNSSNLVEHHSSSPNCFHYF